MQRRTPSTLGLAATLAAFAGAPAWAQSPQAWNSERALALVARARAARQSSVVDGEMRTYSAQARGYVYFFMDRPGSPQPTLVKADQVALEVFWRAPNDTKQRIVGLRDEKLLPTSIRYHLDHLTVVQDDFGDFIRLGDGDEVERVLHPAGPDAENTYDFLLSDSLNIRYADNTEEIRVYQLLVRPKEFSVPGFVGSLFLDRATGAIVRMNFSFTPSSYVDPYLDYIRISLDNSLWMGRHWLPYRQEVEIRREVPALDILVGSVIRNRFEIGQYDFNVDLPLATFLGPTVTSASPAQREIFPFERGLFDDIDERGLAPSPSLDDVREQVREAVQDRYLTGLAALRVLIPSFSDLFRYDRVEGVFLGVGLALRPGAGVLLRTSGGYAIGRREPAAAVSLQKRRAGLTPVIGGYWNGFRDMGGHPGSTGLENTISSITGSKDYFDPFFVRGASLTLQGDDRVGPTVTVRWERHLSAHDVVSDGPDTEFRPVRQIDEGALAALDISLPVGLPGGGRGSLVASAGHLGPRDFVTLDAEALWEGGLPLLHAKGSLSAAAGWVSADAPAQSLHLIGGRNTLPGHDFRAFEGEGYWLVRTEATVPIYPPHVGIRVLSMLGATYLSDRTLPIGWTATDSDGVRISIGAGLSIAWDVMRLDLARGLKGGGWEAVFSVSPDFRSWI